MTLKSCTQLVKLSNNCHIHTNENKSTCLKMLFFLQIYVTTYHTDWKMQKKEDNLPHK